MARAIVAAVMSLALVTTGQAQPTPQEVQALILRSQAFTEPTMMTVTEGQSCMMPPADMRQTVEQGKFQTLIAAGLVTRSAVTTGGAKADGQVGCRAAGGTWTDTRLTEQGRAGSAEWQNHGGVHLIPVGRRHFEHIDNITLHDADTEWVFYTWSFDVSKWGQVVGYLTVPRQTGAILKRSNGHWEISKMD
jgi:hypothetical protein